MALIENECQHVRVQLEEVLEQNLQLKGDKIQLQTNIDANAREMLLQTKQTARESERALMRDFSKIL